MVTVDCYAWRQHPQLTLLMSVGIGFTTFEFCLTVLFHRIAAHYSEMVSVLQARTATASLGSCRSADALLFPY